MKSRFLVSLVFTALLAGLLSLCSPQHAGIIWTLAAIGATIQTAGGPLTDRVRPYELVRWEPNQLYTRTAGTIKNPSATSTTTSFLVPGVPVKLVGAQWTIVLSTDEANLKGLFLGDDSYGIPEVLAQNAITQLKYPILVRGPALVNQSIIPTADPAGAAYNNANIVTALNGLNPPIYTLIEPTGGIMTQST